MKKNMVEAMLRKLLALAILCAMLPVEARATLILVLTLPDGIWIGSDAYRSNGETAPTAFVCKFHQKWDRVVIKYGIEEGTRVSGKYSVDQEVQEILDSAKDWGDFKQKIQARFVQDVQDAIPTYTPEPTAERQLDYMASEQRSIVLLGFEDTTPVIEHLDVAPRNEGAYQLNRYQVNDGGGWKRETASLLRGYPDAPDDSFLERHSAEEIQANPVAMLKEYLDNAHAHVPCLVGPPYAIAHLSAVPASTLTEKKKFHKARTILIPASTKVDMIEAGLCPTWKPVMATPEERQAFGDCSPAGTAER
jgi:hypothetical protein